MKFSSAVTGILAGLLASVVNAEYFSLVVWKPGSTAHLQPVVANNASLWVGKPTLSSCPLQKSNTTISHITNTTNKTIISNRLSDNITTADNTFSFPLCPPGNTTNFFAHYDRRAARHKKVPIRGVYMGTKVPGVQQVWVNRHGGAIKYGRAGEGDKVPKDAYLGGWRWNWFTEGGHAGRRVQRRFSFLLCPVNRSDRGYHYGPWQLFANIDGNGVNSHITKGWAPIFSRKRRCFKIDLEAVHSTGPAAYQYD